MLGCLNTQQELNKYLSNKQIPWVGQLSCQCYLSFSYVLFPSGGHSSGLFALFFSLIVSGKYPAHSVLLLWPPWHSPVPCQHNRGSQHRSVAPVGCPFLSRYFCNLLALQLEATSSSSSGKSEALVFETASTLPGLNHDCLLFLHLSDQLPKVESLPLNLA